MDTYCEHIFKRKKSKANYIFTTMTIFVTLVLLFFITSFLSAASLTFFLPVIWFGILWGAFKIICRTNIEYEYLLTGGDLDVDKIINRSKRVPTLSVRKRQIEFLLPLKDGNIPHDWQGAQRIDVTSGYNPDGVYVLAINKDGRKLVFFEPSQKMLEQLKQKLGNN